MGVEWIEKKKYFSKKCPLRRQTGKQEEKSREIKFLKYLWWIKTLQTFSLDLFCALASTPFHFLNFSVRISPVSRLKWGWIIFTNRQAREIVDDESELFGIKQWSKWQSLWGLCFIVVVMMALLKIEDGFRVGRESSFIVAELVNSIIYLGKRVRYDTIFKFY